jgi:hypothetical protein
MAQSELAMLVVKVADEVYELQGWVPPTLEKSKPGSGGSTFSTVTAPATSRKPK